MKRHTIILNTALYQNPHGFNDTNAAIVDEIPVEAVGNDQLERIFNHELQPPNTGRWMKNASESQPKKGTHGNRPAIQRKTPKSR